MPEDDRQGGAAHGYALSGRQGQKPRPDHSAARRCEGCEPHGLSHGHGIGGVRAGYEEYAQFIADCPPEADTEDNEELLDDVDITAFLARSAEVRIGAHTARLAETATDWARLGR